MKRCKSNRTGCPCKRCTQGWASRRHPTTEAQEEARIAYSRRAEDRPLQRWTDEGWVKV